MATDSVFLPGESPWTEEPGGLQSMAPVFLPGESQGRRSLVGCLLRGRTESDMTEATYTGDRDQDHPHGKEMQKSKMAVWGGFTNSCEKKRSEKPEEGNPAGLSSCSVMSDSS